MPVYCYTTDDGNTTVDLKFPFDKRPESVKLPDGRKARFDFAATASGVRTQKPSCWPMESASCGVHPSQVGEAAQHAKDVGVQTEFCKKTGNAVFGDRSHRRKFLKAHGMHDNDGGYGD